MGQLRKVEIVLEVVTDKPRYELEAAATWDKVHKGYLKIVGARVHSDAKALPVEDETPTETFPAGGEDLS